MNLIFNYFKKILVLTLINIIVVLVICLIKNYFTLHYIGYGIFIGGLIMCLIAGLSVLGFSKTAQMDMRNNYFRSASGRKIDNLNKEYMDSRNKNMNFTIFMALSSLTSIGIGYLINLV